MEGLNVYERMKGKCSTHANVEWMLGTVGMNKHQWSRIRFSNSTYEYILMTGLTFAGSHCGTASELSLYNTNRLGQW
jgi:hypothetical protein